MRYDEVRKILNEAAEKLFQKYVEKVNDVGFDFKDKDSLSSVLPAAKTFLKKNSEMYNMDGKPLIVADDGQVLEYEPVYTSREEFEADLDIKKEVTDLVDNILEKANAKIKKGTKEYKDFCRETLKMLHNLDKRKNLYCEQVESGEFGGPVQYVNGLYNTVNSNMPIKTLRELIDEFIKNKKIEKSWNRNVEKENIRNLERIFEMFEYITSKKNPQIHTLTRQHARNIKEILSVIPTHMKKKFPDKSFKDIISLCKNSNNIDKLSPVSINKYANLIIGMFKFAVNEGYLNENNFDSLRVPENIRKKEREPFTNDELTKFFSTDLYWKKDFILKFSWRYWVPIILLYTGARLEEICQLHLKDINEHDGIQCFDIKDEFDQNTGKDIQSVKNVQSNRLIPVHPILEDIGLLKYIESIKNHPSKRLFPSLTNNVRNKYGVKVSKYFNEKKNNKSYFTKCGITAPNKVLHCFRSTAREALINHESNIRDEFIDKILGHEAKSTGARHYARKHDPETIFKEICKIEYPKAKLPWDNIKEYNKIKFLWE